MSIRIEVFSSPGCSKCGQAKKTLKNIVDEFGDAAIQWREVNILEELDYAVNLGILTTPAIVINGELAFSGLPAAKTLRKRLEALLETG